MTNNHTDKFIQVYIACFLACCILNFWLGYSIRSRPRPNTKGRKVLLGVAFPKIIFHFLNNNNNNNDHFTFVLYLLLLLLFIIYDYKIIDQVNALDFISILVFTVWPSPYHSYFLCEFYIRI